MVKAMAINEALECWIVSKIVLLMSPYSQTVAVPQVADAPLKSFDYPIVIAACHRILTLHAMIRNGALYDPQPQQQLPTAT